MAMTEIGQATITIIPNMKGSQATISKELGAENVGESAGKSLGGSIVSTLKKAVAIAGIGKVIGDTLNQGAALQQSLGGIETLFKDNADVVKGYASEAYKTAGLSANEYMENVTSFSASLIKSMDGDTAAAADLANTAMIDMADNANKMGTDMSSIQNAYQGFAKQNYTMLDNLKLGYGGTKEEMQRLLKDASELSGVEYNIDNLDDVYSAIHVIQEDLGITGTTAKEAAETFSGSFASMKAAAQNVMGNLALGNDIRPQLQELGKSVQTFVVGNVLPMVGNIVKQIPTIIAEIPTFLAEIIPQAIPVMADMVAGLAQGIIDNIPTFIAGLGSLFSSMWGALVNIDWSSAGQIMVDLLTAAWNGLTSAAQGIWDLVVGVFTGEVEFPDLSGFAYTAWNGLITLASTIWTAVKDWFTTTFTWPNISNAAKLVWDKLTEVAESVWNSVSDWFSKTFSFPSLADAASEAWDSVVVTAADIWRQFKGWFVKTFSFPSLTQLAYDAWNGLITLASTIWESIKNWFTSTFSFPSLDDLAKAAWDGLTGIAGGIWDGIKSVFSGWGSDFSIAGITEEQATQAWNTLSTAATNIWDGIKTTFSSFEITWPDFGKLAQDALDGLKTAAEGVWNWVKGLFSGDEDNEAVKSVQGSTTEMATALADAELKVSAVDVSSIQEANTFLEQTVLGWMRIFEGMKTWMILPTPKTNNLQSVSQVLSSWISTWKGQMKFIWTLPTPHGYLPSFSVRIETAGSGDTKASYPVFSKSLQWYAEGGVFNDPQIIGIGDSRGPEAAVPLDLMWKQMSKEFDEHSTPTSMNLTFYVDGAQDPDMWAIGAARRLKQELRMA